MLLYLIDSFKMLDHADPEGDNEHWTGIIAATHLQGLSSLSHCNLGNTIATSLWG